MITAEDQGKPEENPGIGELVSEIDGSIKLMTENARAYFKRPTPGNYRDLETNSINHVYAVNCTVEHIIKSDEDNKTKVRMIDSLLTQTVRLHAKGLNAAIGGEAYSTTGEFKYGVTDTETGATLDMDDPETEIIFPNAEETLRIISDVYAAQIGEDIINLKKLAEQHGIGRVIAVGRQATELFSSHGVDVAKSAAGIALGMIVANKVNGRKH